MPGTTYQPDLAESWSSDEEGRVWTFQIRDDATWQDGVPVTADDVVYTVEALKSPDASGSASAWADITVDALDEKTVALTLGTPIAGALALATQPLLPSHLLEDVPFADLADSDFAQPPVGTGPYALEELDDSHAVLVPATAGEPPIIDEPGESQPLPSADSLLTPFPDPASGARDPYFGTVELRFFPDEAGLAAAFEAGDVDAAAGLSPGPAAVLETLDGVERHVLSHDDAVRGHAQPAADAQGAARPQGPHRPPCGDRPRRARADVARRQRDPRRRVRPADLVGVRRRVRRDREVRPRRRGRRRSRPRAGPARAARAGSRPVRRSRTGSRS